MGIRIGIGRTIIGQGLLQSNWTPLKPLAGENPNFWTASRNADSLIDSIGANNAKIENYYMSKRLNASGYGYYEDTDGSFNLKSVGTSIGVWFKAESLTRATGYHYCVMQKDTPVGEGWRLVMLASGKIYFGTPVSGVAGYVSVIGNSDIQDRNKHFINVLIDNVAKTIKLKIDGVIQTQVTSYTGNPTMKTGTQILKIANGVGGNDMMAPFSYGDIYWYDKCLTDTESTNLYNGIKPTESFAHWTCNVSDDGPFLRDIEGNRNLAINYVGVEVGSLGGLAGIDYGFKTYRKNVLPDIDLPVTLAGVCNSVPASYLNVYTGNAESVMLNRYSCFVRMIGSMWDRSNTTIWGALARAGYYDSTNPKVWHTSELVQTKFMFWANANYQGCFFVKNNAPVNEYGSRLLEIFSYNTKKTGADLAKVLKYCDALDYKQLILNSGFTESYPWSFVFHPWTIANGKAHYDAVYGLNGVGVVRQKTLIDLVIGKHYRLKYTISNCSGNAVMWFSGNACEYFAEYPGTVSRVNGSYDETLECIGTESPSWFELQANSVESGGSAFDLSDWSLELLD